MEATIGSEWFVGYTEVSDADLPRLVLRSPLAGSDRECSRMTRYPNNRS